jgi:hypothetical protein
LHTLRAPSREPVVSSTSQMILFGSRLFGVVLFAALGA